MKKILPFAMLFLLVSCGLSSISKQQLAGKFKVHSSFGTQELLLYANNSYKQIIKIDNPQKTLERKGHWYYSSKTEAVVLENPLDVESYMGTLKQDFSKPVKGKILYPVKRSIFSGKLRLATAEQGEYMHRVAKF